ncbi:hypothetical protein OF83DRAFT_1081934 [Amylostereum chailletii]|nr:hypothetical protein OF83DRAFT_1081934 [Amylostereum chailletii]
MAFLKALEDYINRRDKFTDEAMHLEIIAAGYKSNGEDVDVVYIWKRMYDPHAPLTGANLLACLTIRVLTVIANSAGCERQFSDFGREHTGKLRNKLDEQTVHKTSLLRADLRRQHADLGLLPSRRKRKFGPETREGTEVTATSSSAQSISATHDSSLEADLDMCADFDDYMETLSRNVAEEDEPELASAATRPEVVLPVPTTPSRPPPPFHAIELDVLFDYGRPDAIEQLGLYWNGGIRDMEHEVSALDASGEEVLLA